MVAFLPTVKLRPRPMPPATTTAPVVVENDSAVEDMYSEKNVAVVEVDNVSRRTIHEFVSVE